MAVATGNAGGNGILKRFSILFTCCLTPLIFYSSAWALAVDITDPIDVNKYWDAVDEETDDTDTSDSLMCWAATSSNVLEATGWLASRHTDNYGAYHDYLGSFGNRLGSGTLGYSSYFDTHHAGTNYEDYFVQIHHDTTDPDLFLDNMSWLLDTSDTGDDPYQGFFGIYLSITNGAAGHAITVWDYDADDGIITVTDSDDAGVDFDNHEAHDYQVTFDEEDNRWYLDGFGAGDWYMRRMDALGANDSLLRVQLLTDYHELLSIRDYRLQYPTPILPEPPVDPPVPPINLRALSSLRTWSDDQVLEHYTAHNLSLVADGPNSPFAPVPEPGTLVLLGTGLVSLASYGRKRGKE